MQVFIKIISQGATLIVLDREMEDIMKIVKSLEESVLFIKHASEIIENEAK